MATAANKAKATRTLLLEMGNNRKQKLTVPADAKITFGTLHPGGKNYHDASHGVWLRIYEGTKQTACISGVKAFRDADYPLEVQEVYVSATDHTDTRDGRVAKRTTDYTESAIRWVVEDNEF